MFGFGSSKARKCGLNDDLLEFYSEEGYIGPLQAYSEEEMEKKTKFLYNVILKSKSSIYPKEWKTPSHADDIKVIAAHGRDRHLESKMLYDIVTNPKITDKVACILGNNLIVWRTALFANLSKKCLPEEVIKKFKPLGNEKFTDWHQDNSFGGENGLPAIFPGFSVTAWFSFDYVDASNGCMLFLPKSHRLGPIPYQSQTDNKFYSSGLAYDLDYSKAIEMNCKPGEFVIFDDLTAHGSYRNLSEDKNRCGMSIRYTVPTTLIQKVMMPYDSKFMQGAPDYNSVAVTSVIKPRFPLKDLEIDYFGMDLSNWGCILARGEDKCNVNKYAPAPKSEPKVDDEARLWMGNLAFDDEEEMVSAKQPDWMAGAENALSQCPKMFLGVAKKMVEREATKRGLATIEEALVNEMAEKFTKK